MPTPAHYLVGSARRDVTPPLHSVPYLGWKPRHRPFAGVHDPLHVRAAVVQAGDVAVAIVSADLIGIAPTLLGPGKNTIVDLRMEITHRTGIPSDHVMLAATHAHSTPDLLDFRPLRDEPGGAEYLARLLDTIAACVTDAHRSMVPARLRVSAGRVPGLSRNRRGEPSLDETATVLHFAPAGNVPGVVIVSYACHPAIVQAQPQVSADYPGFLAREVERRTGNACLFLQGACGDINPIKGDTRNFRDVETTGGRLADGVVDLLGPPGRATEPVLIRVAGDTLRLPSRELPTEEELGSPEWDSVRDEVLQRRREGTSPFAWEVQAVRIGNTVLVALAGEVPCRMGMEIREMARPLVAVPVGYANGYGGYVLHPESWACGGYETVPGPWSKVGVGAYVAIVAATRRVVERVGTKKDPPQAAG